LTPLGLTHTAYADWGALVPGAAAGYDGPTGHYRNALPLAGNQAQVDGQVDSATSRMVNREGDHLFTETMDRLRFVMNKDGKVTGMALNRRYGGEEMARRVPVAHPGRIARGQQPAQEGQSMAPAVMH
jgi:CubicO group peptidase (beta-lactamase class C family)